MTTINRVPKQTIRGSESSLNISSEYIRCLKDIINPEQYPKNFDTWSVEEQCNWINANLSKLFPNVPKSLLSFASASWQKNYDRSLTELPEWFDMNKYRKGQRFVHDYYFSIVICKVMGIFYTYSFEDGLKPVIISGRSHTPRTALTRYLETIERISNWYNGEPWVEGTQAYKDMRFVNRIHSMITRNLCQLDNEKIDAMSKIADPWCPDRELFLKDFATVCPFEKPGQRPYTDVANSPYRPKSINNAELAITQAGFISFILLCPENIGIHGATDEDIEAFCHMWRCYGYFLGMKDEYNFCRGSLEEIKQRMRDLFLYWVMPNLKDITPEWEHMTRCLIVSLNYLPLVYMPYKVMSLIAANALDIDMPHLYASLSYVEWIAYKSYTFIFHQILKFSSIRAVLNKLTKKSLHAVTELKPVVHVQFNEKSKMQL